MNSINMEKLRTIFEWIIIFIAIMGVAIDMMTQRSLMSAVKLLNFYTIQSNILVILVMTLVTIMRRHQSRLSKHFGFIVGAVTLWIVATGLIYHFMLSSVYSPEGLKGYANLILHYWTPSLMMVYFLVFVNKDQLNKIYPLIWSSYPMIYGIGCLIKGFFDDFYPYWFLRPYGNYPEGNGSYGSVMIVLLAMVVGFIVLAYVLLLIKTVFNALVMPKKYTASDE